VERLDLRHVLCPLDFSPVCRGALLYASAIARARHADLRVLHVAEKKDVLHGAVGLSSVTRQQLMLKLRACLDEVTSPDQLTGSAVRHGDPATEILKFARALPADMIVAAAGADSRKRPMGHVASVIVARSECPVLIVPGRRALPSSDQTGLFKRIVCAVDMTAASTGVVRQAVAFAWETGGLVTCLCVVPEHAAASVPKVRERLLAGLPLLECGECQVKGLVKTGEAGPEIVRVADTLRADLVVIGPPRRWTSTTHAVLTKSSCPVMVTHELRAIERPAAGAHRSVFLRR